MFIGHFANVKTPMSVLSLLVVTGVPTRQELPPIQNAAGMRLLVVGENPDPVLRIALPGHAASDRSIEVLFPEHVTVVRQGAGGEHLYLHRRDQGGERPQWSRTDTSFEYRRELPRRVELLARATLEEDGVRFRYEFTNRSGVGYDVITAVTDPRLTSVFHDPRLERTWVHHASGLELLASETPNRLTMPLRRWLPARYLASYTWPVPAQLVDRRPDGITYYNKSRLVDQPFIATMSTDSAWTIASFARTTGNVWSNPELTCQHVDPQVPLAPGERGIIEIKILVVRGSVAYALARAESQRNSLR